MCNKFSNKNNFVTQYNSLQKQQLTCSTSSSEYELSPAWDLLMGVMLAKTKLEWKKTKIPTFKSGALKTNYDK